MVKEKRILSYFIGWLVMGFIICFLGIKNIYASEISGFDFLGKDFNGFWIEKNQSITGTLSVSVSDITEIKPYINIIIASTYEPQFSVSSNAYFTDTWTRKLYSYGTSKIGEYNANVYVIQFTTKGLNNWNCSVDGTNCYVNTNITMHGASSYSSIYQLRSISLTDSVLDDDYLKNITINQNNEIIDQNSQIIQGQDNIINNNKENTDSIIDNNNQNTQDILDSNKETQDVIKDQFNSCRDSYNLFSINDFTTTRNGLTISYSNGKFNFNGTSTGTVIYSFNSNYNLTIEGEYTFSTYYLSGTKEGASSNINLRLLSSDSIINGTQLNLTEYNNHKTFYVDNSTIKYGFYIPANVTFNNYNFQVQLQKGNLSTKWESYGEEICTNKLDEQNETQKGILGKIGDLISYINPASENFFVYKLIDLLLDLLKSLFIPEDGYFELWFNDLKMFFEDKLGFLATPFTIIMDFVNRYLDLNPTEDIIINIPDITVPNFEDHIIVKATTFNWSQLLKSKDSLNTLWQLYLSFVDVFLILNFINLCENKYNRIFGGDTTNYEYYTVEDSYNVDVNTGEVKSMRRNERKTTRKKVD